MSQDQEDKQPENRLVQNFAVGVGGTAIGGGIVAAIFAPRYRPYIFLFLITALVLAVIAGGVFFFLRSRKRKRRAGGLETGVKGEFDKQGEKCNDPDLKSRLEQMKRKFMLLIDRLREEGHRNIYEMPWFLTIGPSGTGKSWVLKGGGLERLGDDEWEQGTYLIDWWSCGEALVLDTAGGIVFGEEYDMPEWQSLLAHLKEHRPQCPINGLLVVIPAQMLWLKEEELPPDWKWLTLGKYADALRSQIRERLQRQLGVRFPVYFLVTQSDRIPGFREFADALEASGKPKEQMLGWSNPRKVGSENKISSRTGNSGTDPELEEIKTIGLHLRQVAEDLRRQRLVLLKKYAGESARSDDTGMKVRERASDLFSFPDAVQNTLAPRLQEFLTSVFKTVTGLPKPPFVRGIYFTSSLREGEVLDRQRARVGGRSLAELALPGRGDRKQVNPFFLKDLLFKKAFLESWLVMPLMKEARKYLRERRRTLVLSGIGAIVILLLAIVLGGYSYLSTVGQELNEWEAVADQVSIQQYWLPVVTNDDTGLKLVPENIEMQAHLANVARAGSSWSFWSSVNEPRRKAQRKLFERGAIMPLADAVRRKIANSKTASIPSNNSEALQNEVQRFQGAFVGILELELCPTNNKWNPTDLAKSRNRVIDGFVDYLFPDQKESKKDSDKVKLLKSLKAAFDDTYDKDRQKLWPPAFNKQPQDFAELTDSAFRRIGELQQAQVKLFGIRRKKLEDLVKIAKDVTDSEETLIEDIRNRKSLDGLKNQVGEIRTKWTDLVEQLNRDKVQSFQQSFTNFATYVENDARGRQERLRQQIREVSGATDRTNLIPVLEDKFKMLAEDVTPQTIRQLTNFGILNKTAFTLDANLLAPSASTDQETQTESATLRLFDRRLAVYEQLIESLRIQLPRHWDQDVFEDRADPWPTIESITNSALQVWGKLQTPAFAGLSFGNIAWSEILCHYVVFRHFEEVLKRSESKTKEILGQEEYDVSYSAKKKPKDMLLETDGVVANLRKLQAAWNELQKEWESLGGNREYAPIRRSAAAISNKRSSILEACVNNITEEQNRTKGFPFNGDNPTLVESDVRDSWKRAVLWRDAAENSKLDADTKLQMTERIAEWLNHFKMFVDDKGDILEYEVRTPWDEFLTAFGNKLDKDDFDKAKTSAGKYRSWKFGRATLKMDDPQGHFSIGAVAGFAMEAREDDTHPPVKIENPPRNDGWTIIDLIKRSGSNRAPYFVPIDVNGAKVWIVVRPVDLNRR